MHPSPNIGVHDEGGSLHDEAALVGSPGLGPQGPEGSRVRSRQGPLFANDPARLLLTVLVDEDGFALGADVPASLLHDEVIWRAVLLKDKDNVLDYF